MASAEPPLEWSKCTAVVEMAVFAKDGIEVRNLLRDKPELVDPPNQLRKLKSVGKLTHQEKTEKNGTKKNALDGRTDAKKHVKKSFCVIQWHGNKRVQR